MDEPRGLALFRLPPALEPAFRRQFSTSRHSGDLVFFAIHCLVAVGYFCNVPSLLSLQSLLMLGGSLLPAAVYCALPRRLRLRLRTPIITALKLCMTAALVTEMANDYGGDQIAPDPWPIFAFRLCFTGRVVALLAVGLGLQLPLVIDGPLQLAAGVAAMLSAAPRQCELRGAAPSPTLFSLNRDKFQGMQALLDAPFAPIVGAPDVLALSDLGLCTAVYLWVQLVGAVAVPATALYVTESLERRRFLRTQRAAAAAAAALEHKGRPADRAGVMQEDSEGSQGGSWVWTYLIFGAQVGWCLIRTAAKLMG